MKVIATNLLAGSRLYFPLLEFDPSRLNPLNVFPERWTGLRMLRMELLSLRSWGVSEPVLEFDPSRLNPRNEFGIALMLFGLIALIAAKFIDHEEHCTKTRMGGILVIILGALIVLVST